MKGKMGEERAIKEGAEEAGPEREQPGNCKMRSVPVGGEPESRLRWSCGHHFLHAKKFHQNTSLFFYVSFKFSPLSMQCFCTGRMRLFVKGSPMK